MPGMEAHGGYTFCGVAALVILKKEQLLNLRSLLVSILGASRGAGGGCPRSHGVTRSPLSPPQHWVTSRQMRFEGGFQGRCNKLVDGCYSFWQAGLLPLLHHALHAQGEPGLWGGEKYPVGSPKGFLGAEMGLWASILVFPGAGEVCSRPEANPGGVSAPALPPQTTRRWA